MDEFIIKTEKGVKLTFHSRRFNSDGCLSSYLVSGEAPGFRGDIEVENPPYGNSPVAFFKQIAEAWSGWKGEKGWGAMEGEFNLSATCDSLGHITFIAELNPNGYPPCWSANLSLVVDAGQLKELSNSAKVFFNESV